MATPKNNGKAVSLRDVAVAAGVSRMSASRALREGTQVSAELRARVRRAAEKVGYRGDQLVSELMTSFAKRRVPAFRETLAALWWEPWPELDAPNHDFGTELRRGLHAGAERHGCRIDDVLITPKTTGEALRRRLAARGIRGLILTPPPSADQPVPALVWDDFSAVIVGSSLRKPSLNRAQNHHYQAMERALAEIAARGYRRPVLLMQASVEERSRRAYLAAFLAWRGAESAGDIHPDAHDDDTGLGAWVKRRRADVVIAENDRVLAHVARSLDMPGAMGGLSLDAATRTGGVSGIFKDVRRLAIIAVDLLLQARWRQETGLPESPVVLMNEGVWVEGATLRANGFKGGGNGLLP